MRIVLFEMREERRVGEVLQARGVVGHAILWSWEVERVVVVSVLSLVLASVVA